MIPLSRIVSASRLFALRTSRRGRRPAARRAAPCEEARPWGSPGAGQRSRSRACRVPVRGSRKRGTAAPQVPGAGAGGRSDEAYPPLEQRNAARRGGTPGVATLPRKRTPRYYDYSLLAASYPNYIDPISLHISSLSRDRRRGLCGPTPGLFERRGLCGPAELAAEGGCGEAARSRRGPDSIAPAAQIRSITVTTRGVVLILAARSKRGLEVVLMKPHVRSELATRNHS